MKYDYEQSSAGRSNHDTNHLLRIKHLLSTAAHRLVEYHRPEGNVKLIFISFVASRKRICYNHLVFKFQRGELFMFKSYLITFLISMVPLVELRGAIPYGTLIANPPLPLLNAYILCIIGNMLPVPIIFFFARKVLEWGKDKRFIGKFFTFCIEKGRRGGEKLKSKAGRGVYLALLLFVGIPIPGTGAWTGTLAASFLDLDFKKSTIAVMLGVLLAGVIIGLLSLGGINLLNK